MPLWSHKFHKFHQYIPLISFIHSFIHFLSPVESRSRVPPYRSGYIILQVTQLLHWQVQGFTLSKPKLRFKIKWKYGGQIHKTWHIHTDGNFDIGKKQKQQEQQQKTWEKPFLNFINFPWKWSQKACVSRLPVTNRIAHVLGCLLSRHLSPAMGKIFLCSNFGN